MLRFSKDCGKPYEENASRDEQKEKKDLFFYHIEVAVLCPVQKNWLISNHNSKKKKKKTSMKLIETLNMGGHTPLN